MGKGICTVVLRSYGADCTISSSQLINIGHLFRPESQNTLALLLCLILFENTKNKIIMFMENPKLG